MIFSNNCSDTPCTECNDCVDLPPVVCPPGPIYTIDPTVSSDDVKYVGPTDACTPVTTLTSLTTVITNIIAAIKRKVFNISSSSLSVTNPTNNLCDKVLNVELVPSIQAGNVLILGSDGKPYVPTPGSVTIPTLQIADTQSINLSGLGTLISPLTADAIINPNPLNILSITPSGLLAVETNPFQDETNLVQHAIFEKPPITALTYTDNNNNIVSRTKVTLNSGGYASNYSANNPDVKLYWDKNTLPVENSLDNEVGVGNSLSHDYVTLQPESGEIELKTYNTSYINNIYTANTAISGFKFFKGASLILNVSVGGGQSGGSGIYDFKNMFNLQTLYIGQGNREPNVRHTLKNVQDLKNLISFDLFGFFEGETTLQLFNPAFYSGQLLYSRGIKNVIGGNQTNMNFQTDASSIDTLDFSSANLNILDLNNCGYTYNGHINNVMLKLKLPSPIFPITTGQFDFGSVYKFNIARTNGLVLSPNVYIGYDQVIPTKFLMYNPSNSYNKEWVDSTQDWVKDELFISLDNNGIINGSATSYIPFGLGEKYLADYYNPTWTPLNGSNAGISATIVGTSVSDLSNRARPGSKYNSIPTVITSGPGAGLISNAIMQMEDTPALITIGGTGYSYNDVVTITGTGALVSPTIRVLSVSSGAITGYRMENKGEFNTLPATLTDTVGGFTISTTGKWSFKYANITNGGTGYNSTTKFKLEVSTSNGTGTGTASSLAKTAIDNLHLKGWDLAW